jgi:hypothetical protein
MPPSIIGIEINVTLCAHIIVHDYVTHNYFTNISGAYGEDQKIPIKALNII